MHAKALRLAETVTRLGFEHESQPGADTQMPLAQCLEWLFTTTNNSDQDLFLDWLTDAFSECPAEISFGGGHVLGAGDILHAEESRIPFARPFRILQSHGQSADHLDSLLHPDTASDSDVEALQQELRELEEYSHLLERNEHELLRTLKTVDSEIQTCEKEDEISSTRLIDESAALENVSLQVDIALKQLHEHLIEAVNRADTANKSESIPAETSASFLYQCTSAFSDFMNEDELLSESLISLYEDTFNQSVGSKTVAVAHASGVDREELLEDLSRLTELHAVTEQQYLNALMGFKFAEAKLRVLDEFNYGQQPEHDLRSMTKAFQLEISPLQESIRKMVEAELPSLWVDLAEYAVKAPILRTEYESKISRHQRLLKHLEKFTNILLAQQSRHQFLAIALETELSMIKRYAHLVESVQMELALKVDHIEKRMDWYNRPDLAMDMPENRVVDSRDSLMVQVMKLLEMDGSETPNDVGHAKTGAVVFTSIDSVIAHASELAQKVKRADEQLHVAEKKRMVITQDLSNACNGLLSMLYKYSSTSIVLHAPKEWYELQLTLRDTATELQPLLRLAGKDADVIQQVVHEAP
ncbi:hypothetical protein CcCBS67573_g05792 [Chytriomyces confervae]|uniref:HAUS augmin-like complex subunit 3 N-terminal domain-containing protein n=1 Tax=Chytriomyces confervae TaxID=246404 RepID=A0A507FB91_9FUNG|nr:hypothetical protein HDU80_005964 [Chytriomyces hyalinus]TPX72528.1 hypothetical protein CcCBS67573_g05792 [Chytriomyces confervae]